MRRQGLKLGKGAFETQYYQEARNIERSYMLISNTYENYLSQKRTQIDPWLRDGTLTIKTSFSVGLKDA